MTDDHTDSPDARLQAVLRGASPSVPEVSSTDTEQAWRRLASRTVDTESTQRPSGEQGRPSQTGDRTSDRASRHLSNRAPHRTASNNHRAMFATAIVAVLALFAAGIGLTRTSAPSQTRNPARTYVTRDGQRSEFTLRDGTRVILAPQSALTVRGNVASLIGEAFFTVRPNTERPLVVQTGNVATRVLGTTFAVRRYPDERVTRVVVVEGKVQSGGAQTAILTARSIAYVTDSVVTAVTVADPSVYTQWTTGQLVFQNAPVAEVLHTVERWYGVTFRVTDTTFTSDRLTTALDARRNRSETLAALGVVLTVRMTINGDTVTLAPRRSPPARATLPRRNTLLTPSTGYGR